MRLKGFLLSLGTLVALCFLGAGVLFSTEQKQPVPHLVVLDSLSTLYGGVSFDHALHDSYAACVECHHHVAGQPSVDPACSSCHRSATFGGAVDCKSCHEHDRFSGDSMSARSRLSRYHIDTTGLIGAYHLNCLGCHLSLTAGPTGCLDCHQRQENNSSDRHTTVGTDKETEK
jgi:hypothetical protein